MGLGLGFFSSIIIGLIAGAIAKLILPGKQGGGILATLLLGVIGAIVGGLIGGLIGWGGNGFWSLGTWVLSIIGALIVLFVWGLITGRKGK